MQAININALVEELKVWNHTVHGKRVVEKMLKALYPSLEVNLEHDDRDPIIIFAEFRKDNSSIKAIAPLVWEDRYDINPLTRKLINVATA